MGDPSPRQSSGQVGVDGGLGTVVGGQQGLLAGAGRGAVVEPFGKIAAQLAAGDEGAGAFLGVAGAGGKVDVEASRVVTDRGGRRLDELLAGGTVQAALDRQDQATVGGLYLDVLVRPA